MSNSYLLSAIEDLLQPLMACILKLWEIKVAVYSKKEMKTLLAFEDAFNFLSCDLGAHKMRV